MRNLKPIEVDDGVMVQATCIACKFELSIKLTKQEWLDYLSGDLCENCLSRFSPDIRELFISGMCGKCYDYIVDESI